MKTKSMMWAAAPLLLAITATAAKAQTSAPAPGGLDPYDAVSESLLWNFAGSPADGASPYASLIADKWGNLYSTTINGGANDDGAVFELSPPSGTSSQWSEQVLYSFAGGPDDGERPYAGLLADRRGNLYGTTESGGANHFLGAVFELSPPSGTSLQWSEQVLWNFGGPDDGELPYAGLIADKSGNLYGTTFEGGTIGLGTVFELSPPSGKSAQWSEQVLWSFSAAGDDGYVPQAGLIADKSGNLYGTTLDGGTDVLGTVFKLSPPYGKSRQWSERVLWSFAGSPDDGADPFAALLADQRGNLYGTTTAGGADGDGTVFKLSLPY